MIIPLYRVVTSQVPVASNSGNIEAGMVIALNSSGEGIKAIAQGARPMGLSGDRKRASEAFEWVNRVSDSGNETAASGAITVYHGGGEFWVDVDDSAIKTPEGTTVTGVVAAASAGLSVSTLLYVGSTDGQLSHTQGGSDIPVAMALTEAVSLESGIPGEYEPGSSIDYVDDSVPRTFVKIKLLI